MPNAFLDAVTDQQGVFQPQRMSETLRIPMARLARIAKVHRNSLSRHPEIRDRPRPPRSDRTQHRDRLRSAARRYPQGDGLVPPSATIRLRWTNSRGIDRRRPHRRRVGASRDPAGRRLRLILRLQMHPIAPGLDLAMLRKDS